MSPKIQPTKKFFQGLLWREICRGPISKRQLNGSILCNSNVRIFLTQLIAMLANLLPRQLAFNLPSLFSFSPVLFFLGKSSCVVQCGDWAASHLSWKLPCKGKRRRKWEGGQSLPPSLRRSKSSNSGPRSRAPFSSPYV